jgi:hypothetical protein
VDEVEGPGKSYYEFFRWNDFHALAEAVVVGYNPVVVGLPLDVVTEFLFAARSCGR